MQMYAVERQRDQAGLPISSIIELEEIVQPCYLYPRFGSHADTLGSTNSPNIIIDGDNCIELVDRFWINSFQDQSTYQTVF